MKEILKLQINPLNYQKTLKSLAHSFPFRIRRIAIEELNLSGYVKYYPGGVK